MLLQMVRVANMGVDLCIIYETVFKILICVIVSLHVVVQATTSLEV